MSTYPVTVSGISTTTSEATLRDFFTFCGTIAAIEHRPAAQTATIRFAKASAAQTALMLNGGALDGAHLAVHSDAVHADTPEPPEPHAAGAPLEQSDKPRAGIAAEYLARGYTLSDNVLQRAIDLDAKHGISGRFLSYFHTLDAGLGSRAIGPEKTLSGKVQETLTDAQAKAKEMDEQKGLSKTASDYYSKALAHPLGKSIFSFYTTTTKQVRDIHDEARRIADHQKGAAAAAAAPAAATAASDEKPPVPAPTA